MRSGQMLPPRHMASTLSSISYLNGWRNVIYHDMWSMSYDLLVAGQTFEGGISGRPDAEAHGAYAFCALACLCILGEPQTIIPQ